MKQVLILLAVLGAFGSAKAGVRESNNMILGHWYNVTNSIGGIENNFSIKETWFVSDKSICRHLGVLRGAVDAIQTTLTFDQELAKLYETRGIRTASELQTEVNRMTSYCGQNHVAERFEADKEANRSFLKSQMGIISNKVLFFGEDVTRVRQVIEK